eukprot:2125326-Ditylum_brightwellii.AAC.1
MSKAGDEDSVYFDEEEDYDIEENQDSNNNSNNENVGSEGFDKNLSLIFGKVNLKTKAHPRRKSFSTPKKHHMKSPAYKKV